MQFSFAPIGFVRTGIAKEDVPRHFSDSDAVGSIEIAKRYLQGIRDIRAGDEIYVIFVFHESPPFSSASLMQVPALRREPKGVFSIGSPRRPNPIGLSIVKVLEVADTRIKVQGIDMFDGTPVLDIKPCIAHRHG